METERHPEPDLPSGSTIAIMLRLALCALGGHLLGAALRSGPFPMLIAGVAGAQTVEHHGVIDAPVEAPVVPGIEVLLRDSVHLLAGKRVGLLTNHSGRDRAGRRSIDLLHEAAGFSLVAIFAPEHGLAGTARGGAHIAASVDSATGVPIRSLYGRRYTPSREMLADVDVLLYDVQDVGARPYTFVWTMTLAADAAARLGKQFIVLDRPNPIRGDRIEGGVLRPAYRSLVGREAVPMRYGLTPGELAHWLVAVGRLPRSVRVVPMRNYRQSLWYDETELPWLRPSPNITDLDAALLFPGIVFFEATNVSEGRGTDRPFRLVGAPWLRDAPAVVAEMNALRLPGVRFAHATRTIGRGEKFAGRQAQLVEIQVTDRDAVRPVELGVRLMRAIYERHQREWRWQPGNGMEQLSGSRELRDAVTTSDAAVDRLLTRWDREARFFARDVAPYRLYPR
ncbi:MAG TPA: DUF1343 domain-containing protein [Gemmatimonadaceae bacterium]|nr:DUF1343 domain-containing protein [Gemmatimonadaceae bacterium]